VRQSNRTVIATSTARWLFAAAAPRGVCATPLSVGDPKDAALVLIHIDGRRLECSSPLVLPPTRDRILDGAAEAVARYGLAKLEMQDVSTTSGVSRPTLYRYFPRRDVLLAQLAEREGRRFQERMLRAIEDAPPGAERVRVAFEHATRHIRDHRVLQRLLETDPGFLLSGMRRYFPIVKADLAPVLRPLFEETGLVERGVVTADELIDWMLRLMVSAFLLPHPEPDEMAHGLTAVYRIVTEGNGKQLITRRHPKRRPKPRTAPRRRGTSGRTRPRTSGRRAPA
jgi:AcrR family transcriptional regulator